MGNPPFPDCIGDAFSGLDGDFGSVAESDDYLRHLWLREYGSLSALVRFCYIDAGHSEAQRPRYMGHGLMARACSISISGRMRPNHAGNDQLARPISFIVARTRIMRTTVASTKIAVSRRWSGSVHWSRLKGG